MIEAWTFAHHYTWNLPFILSQKLAFEEQLSDNSAQTMEEYALHTSTQKVFYTFVSKYTLNTRVSRRVSARIVYAKGVCLRACIRLCGREWEWWVIRNPWGFTAVLSFLPHVTACWGKHPAQQPYSQTTSTLHLKRTLNLQRGKDCEEINPHLLCNVVPINAAVWFKIKYTEFIIIILKSRDF